MDIAREPPPKRKKYLPAGIALAAIVLTTFGLSRLKPAAPSVDGATIWMDTVEQGLMLIRVSGPGNLVPEQIRWIPAEVQGRVERKLVQPGTEVTANTILVELSNPDVQLQLLESERQLSAAQQELVMLRSNLQTQRLNQESLIAQLHSQYLEAKRNVEDLEELARKGEGYVSDSELQTARERAHELEVRTGIEARRLEILQDSEEPQLRVQQDQIERLTGIVEFQKQRIASMQVRAGINGVLQEMDLEEGQWVMNGQTLARVVVPERLKAELRIPQTQATNVALGQAALVDTRTDTIQGQVVRIDPAAQGGVVVVDVALPAELPRSARPGLAVEGIIEIERLEDVLFVGRPAYGQAHNTVGLFKLVDGGSHAERVNVRLGRSSVNYIEIVEGLHVGDVVVLTDMSQWDAYDRVRIRG
ncbi:MAG: HlyD family efflux transporter periplasmic adaptor subunit [Gemmatimonadota bacterium]|nr:MAG: HlyD family efflux transporter periplasmic adaptor subunit [Gemmatimonadota bacterium]